MAQLQVKVSPRAKQNEIVGWHQNQMLIVKIAAPPVGGKANDELVKFLAEQLGVPASDILILRGHTSKQKVLEIAGLSDEEVRQRLGAR